MSPEQIMSFLFKTLSLAEVFTYSDFQGPCFHSNGMPVFFVLVKLVPYLFLKLVCVAGTLHVLLFSIRSSVPMAIGFSPLPSGL